MIVPTVTLSLIFVGLGFIVTENNAQYLLAGYNTISEEERQKFDIKSYISYFRNFHIFLGISLFIISLILFYLVNSDWSAIFMVTYPILAYIYFIWKGNQFLKYHDKKQKVMTLIVIIFMLSIFITIVYMFMNTLKDNQVEFKHQTIRIKGYDGMELNIKDIKSIELVNELPEISSKINGFALNTVQKGYFKTKNGEKIKLLINSPKAPIVLITVNDNQRIYYSSKEKSNREVFDHLKKFMGK